MNARRVFYTKRWLISGAVALTVLPAALLIAQIDPKTETSSSPDAAERVSADSSPSLAGAGRAFLKKLSAPMPTVESMPSDETSGRRVPRRFIPERSKKISGKTRASIHLMSGQDRIQTIDETTSSSDNSGSSSRTRASGKNTGRSWNPLTRLFVRKNTKTKSKQTTKPAKHAVSPKEAKAKRNRLSRRRFVAPANAKPIAGKSEIRQTSDEVLQQQQLERVRSAQSRRIQAHLKRIYEENGREMPSMNISDLPGIPEAVKNEFTFGHEVYGGPHTIQRPHIPGQEQTKRAKRGMFQRFFGRSKKQPKRRQPRRAIRPNTRHDPRITRTRRPRPGVSLNRAAAANTRSRRQQNVQQRNVGVQYVEEFEARRPRRMRVIQPSGSPIELGASEDDPKDFGVILNKEYDDELLDDEMREEMRRAEDAAEAAEHEDAFDAIDEVDDIDDLPFGRNSRYADDAGVADVDGYEMDRDDELLDIEDVDPNDQDNGLDPAGDADILLPDEFDESAADRLDESHNPFSGLKLKNPKRSPETPRARKSSFPKTESEKPAENKPIDFEDDANIATDKLLIDDERPAEMKLELPKVNVSEKIESGGGNPFLDNPDVPSPPEVQEVKKVEEGDKGQSKSDDDATDTTDGAKPSKIDPTKTKIPKLRVPDSVKSNLTKEEEILREKMHRIAERFDQPGFRGFCPITLRNKRDLIDSKQEFSSQYKSKTFHFSSLEAKETFDKAPQKYAPVADGADVVLLTNENRAVPGSLEHAAWFKDRLYFFSSRESLEAFTLDPTFYFDSDSEPADKK